MPKRQSRIPRGPVSCRFGVYSYHRGSDGPRRLAEGRSSVREVDCLTRAIPAGTHHPSSGRSKPSPAGVSNTSLIESRMCRHRTDDWASAEVATPHPVPDSRSWPAVREGIVLGDQVEITCCPSGDVGKRLGGVAGRGSLDGIEACNPGLSCGNRRNRQGPIGSK